MAYLVVLILDNIDQCNSLLDAWEAAGAKGVTILESSGLGRLRRAGLRDDLPLMPRLQDLLESKERPHRTLLSVVETEEETQALIEAAQSVVGDFDTQNTGLLFIVPVLQVFGLNKQK